MKKETEVVIKMTISIIQNRIIAHYLTIRTF